MIHNTLRISSQALNNYLYSGMRTCEPLTI